MHLLAAQDWITLTVVAAVTLLAATVQRVTGFAFGLVIIGLLPAVFDRAGTATPGIRLANLVSSVSAILLLVGMVWQFARYVDRGTLVRTIAGGLCGLPLGLAVFEFVSPVWLARLTGAVILLLTLHMLLRRPFVESAPAHPNWSIGAGLAAGFLHGAVGLPGPPVALFAANQKWPPNTVRGYVACSLVGIALLKVGLFAWRGHVDREVLSWTLITLPAVITGYGLGALLARRLNAMWFHYLVLLIVALSAVQLLATSTQRAGRDATQHDPSITPGAR
jgi:uncharacterized membrane protein YfcA